LTHVPKEQKNPIIRTNTQTATEMYPRDTMDTADTFEARTEHGVVKGASNHLASPVTSEDQARPDAGQRRRMPQKAPKPDIRNNLGASANCALLCPSSWVVHITFLEKIKWSLKTGLKPKTVT
jgi:hypothetical protein